MLGALAMNPATQTSGRPPMASLSFTDFLSWALKNLMGLARATVRSGCTGASQAWYGEYLEAPPPNPHLPRDALSCPTLEADLRKSEWKWTALGSQHAMGLLTCPGVRYIVFHLQEDEERGHGEGHVALAAQAQMVVACGRDRGAVSRAHCCPAPYASSSALKASGFKVREARVQVLAGCVTLGRLL